MKLICNLCLSALLLATGGARAATFSVELNTTPLSGTQTLAFSLTNGDGVTDNSIQLSNFSFGSGKALGSPTYQGTGVSGNLAGGVKMKDSDFLELFSQQFTAGSSLSFTLNTTDAFAGGSPDGFLLYLCDATFSTCYSDDAVTDSLLALSLTGTPLTTADLVLNGAVAQGLHAPMVEAVPEPGLGPIVAAIGLGGALVRLRRLTGRSAAG
jgi:hypothetical protein